METHTLPSVSIVIAAHNEGDYVERTVASILAHTTHAAYEICLIDDGSSDASFQFLQRVPYRHDARFRHHRFEAPVGCIRARHQGATMAAGDLLVFLDAHMALPPGWLTQLCQAHVRWGRQTVITPGVTTLDVSTWQPGAPQHEVLTINEQLDFVWRTPPYPTGLLATVGGCSVLMARSLYAAVGGFDLGLRRWGCEFVDLALKVYAAGGACYLEPTVRVGHLFRKVFPYPMSHRDLTYNKLRVGYIHLSDASFSRLRDALHGTPGLDKALALFHADRPDLDAHRHRQRTTNQRPEDWFVRMFLPGLCEDAGFRKASPLSAAPAKNPRARAEPHQQTGKIMTPVTRDAMERFARLLRDTKARQTVTADLIRTLHDRFRAVDEQGRAWTVGLHNLRWHRLDQGRWTPADPPPNLSMDEGTHLALQALGEAAQTATPTASPAPVPIRPEQMETLAQQLQDALDAGRLTSGEDKALHARFRARTPDGVSWTVGLRSLRWHVLSDGRWREDVPPAELLLDASLYETLKALAPASPAPASSSAAPEAAEGVSPTDSPLQPAPEKPSTDALSDQKPDQTPPSESSPPPPEARRTGTRKRVRRIIVGLVGLAGLVIGSVFLYEYYQLHWAPPAVSPYKQIAWAPDGRRIAFTGTDAEHRDRLYIGNLDDGTFRLLKKDAGGHVSWSPKGRWIAYMGLWQLTLVRPEGDAEVVVEPYNLYPTPTAWSPDGKWIAYWAQPESKCCELRLAQADDNGPQIQTLFVTETHRPVSSAPVVWSPDGQYLTMSMRRVEDEMHQILILDRQQGTIISSITGNDYAFDVPSWSPDSGWIYFSGHTSSSGKVFRSTRSANQITELTKEDVILTSAALSPDGARLVYIVETGIFPRYEIRVMDTENGVAETINIGMQIMSDTPLYWSPTGQHIAVLVLDRDYRYNISVVDRQGNALRLIQ